MRAWIVTTSMLIVVALVPGMAVADNAIAKSFGEAGRAIVNDSRSAYECSRVFFVDMGQSVSQGAREAYEDARHIGPQIVQDVKDGFNGHGGQAPDSTKVASPMTGKP